MKKSLRTWMGTGVLAATALGMGGLAHAATAWGPLTPTQSQVVTDHSATPPDTVTMQTTVFNGAAFATVNSNVGPFKNLMELDCSDGTKQAKQVVGTNPLNGNVAFFCPFFTTAVQALGIVESD
ncbi:MAG: hypothetical protein ACREJ3_15780 [Polyangiaceae bacterium]